MTNSFKIPSCNRVTSNVPLAAGNPIDVINAARMIELNSCVFTLDYRMVEVPTWMIETDKRTIHNHALHGVETGVAYRLIDRFVATNGSTCYEPKDRLDRQLVEPIHSRRIA